MKVAFRIGIIALGIAAHDILWAANPTLFELKHEMDNHEMELRMFEERLVTQENIIDSLRQQLHEANQKNRELVKGNTSTLEKRIAGLEASIASISSDLKNLQMHSNDSAKAISQYKQNLVETDRHLDNLHDNLSSLMKALQADVPETTNTYQVQKGDSLEKIARKHNTTVKKIIEQNNLQTDRIFIGQVLNLEKNDKNG